HPDCLYSTRKFRRDPDAALFICSKGIASRSGMPRHIRAMAAAWQARPKGLRLPPEGTEIRTTPASAQTSISKLVNH
ncbi:MAG: hypothetical protein OXN84_06190, partial [Albidovulum sp.]|nr:hypothetical protein [Albidovulum sp.]